MSKKEFTQFAYQDVKDTVSFYYRQSALNQHMHRADFYMTMRNRISQSNFFMQGCK